jgi:hypothetical protein
VTCSTQQRLEEQETAVVLEAATLVVAVVVEAVSMR